MTTPSTQRAAPRQNVALHSWRVRAAGDDTGSVSLFLIVGVLALFAVFGLVVDGGARLDGQRRVTDTAEQAARAAAQAIDPAALRAGAALRLDPAAARRAAATYLAAISDMTLTGVTVTTAEVTVTVSTVVHPTVLAAAGLDALTVTGTGHAQLLTPPSNAITSNANSTDATAAANSRASSDTSRP